MTESTFTIDLNVPEAFKESMEALLSAGHDNQWEQAQSHAKTLAAGLDANEREGPVLTCLETLVDGVVQTASCALKRGRAEDALRLMQTLSDDQMSFAKDGFLIPPAMEALESLIRHDPELALIQAPPFNHVG